MYGMDGGRTRTTQTLDRESTRVSRAQAAGLRRERQPCGRVGQNQNPAAGRLSDPGRTAGKPDGKHGARRTQRGGPMIGLTGLTTDTRRQGYGETCARTHMVPFFCLPGRLRSESVTSRPELQVYSSAGSRMEVSRLSENMAPAPSRTAGASPNCLAI